MKFVIFRGKGGATPTGYAITTSTSYQNAGLQSAYTSCYYVKAQDATGNASGATPTLFAMTPDTVSPTVPTTVAATAASSTVANVTPTATSNTDPTAQPRTGCTYKVLAYDAAGNKSGLSAGARVTTPK